MAPATVNWRFIWILDDKGKELCGLETTLIGSSIDGDALKVSGLEEVVDSDTQSENSWKTFAAAIGHANKALTSHQKDFQNPENQNYKLISVAQARKEGILAIGFHSNEKFNAAPKSGESELD